MIEYDSSAKALFFPEASATVFSPGAKPADEGLAIEASRLAYLHFETNAASKAELTAALANAGFETPTTFNDRKAVPIGFFTDSQGFAAIRKSDGVALLAFRGTQPTRPRDILLDLDFHFVSSDDWPGRVHHGFLHGAQALYPAVKRWLDGEGTARKSLLVCGHSLGAAIATLIAMRTDAKRLITIGCPRVGDAEFVKGLEAKTFSRTRIVDSRDIVAQIPPKFLGYCHPQNGVFIDSNGHVVKQPTPDLVDREVGSDLLLRFSLPDFLGLPPELSDHATVNYLRAFWP